MGTKFTTADVDFGEIAIGSVKPAFVKHGGRVVDPRFWNECIG